MEDEDHTSCVIKYLELALNTPVYIDTYYLILKFLSRMLKFQMSTDARQQ